MRKRDYSIHTILGLIIGFMGALALLLALASGEVHRNHAFNNQRLSMEKLIRLKSADLLDNLARRSGELGASLQMAPGFQQAIMARDTTTLEQLMNNQFHDYFVTTGMLKLEELAIFDPVFAPIARVRGDVSQFSSTAEACASLLQLASKRSGPDRMKLLSGTCVHDNYPFHAVIQPIGGLRLKGYMAVVTDPTHNLSSMETALGMPLSILLPDHRVIYRSKNWPTASDLANSILAEYQTSTDNAETSLILSVADDVRPLMGYLPQTRMAVMVAVALITLVGILLAIWVLRKTALNPLNQLAGHLQEMRGNRRLLGQKISVGGSREIRALANNFNEMSGELSKLHESLETMAYGDALTGLPNRNRMLERVQRQLWLHRDDQSPFALMIMDLDRFKIINETLGHQVGDLLLKEIAARLEKVLRTTPPVTRPDRSRAHKDEEDVVARLGGDEFSVLVANLKDMVEAGQIARRLMRAMEEPFHINEHKLPVTMSIGIALFPMHGTTQNDLMRRADVAMYHAKKTRVGHVVYDSSLDGNSLRRLTLERDLRDAIINEQLVLHYQPKINLKTGEVCGAEALVRWCHPELGMVPPDEFISLAEQSGQIHSLTAWVIDRAVRDCGAWRQQAFDIGVSVNLSAVNLRDSDFPEKIRKTLERNSFNPEHLVLELTESAVMSDPVHALQVLEGLRKSGVGLSIDDFGTGYSSLAYLKKLPVTEIKVDRSFVRDMAKDNGDESIIRAVVALAQHRELSVVAEGVEDRTTYDLLGELNCGMVQGYYIAKPMPLEMYITWMGSSDWRPRHGRADRHDLNLARKS